MIYAEEALRQIAELEIHYENLNRPEATRGLLMALVIAEEAIAARPESGLLAPRPYLRWPARGGDGPKPGATGFATRRLSHL